MSVESSNSQQTIELGITELVKSAMGTVIKADRVSFVHAQSEIQMLHQKPDTEIIVLNIDLHHADELEEMLRQLRSAAVGHERTPVLVYAPDGVGENGSLAKYTENKNAPVLVTHDGQFLPAEVFDWLDNLPHAA
jgi:hypothetical protein